MAHILAYQPCKGCVKCHLGAKGAGRVSYVWLIHLFTCGITLIVAAAMKCPRCGHTTFLNSHAPKGFDGDK